MKNLSAPIVVTLCGSTRFKAAFEKAMKDETLAGQIVLTVGMFGHQEGLDMTGPVKQMLDALHLRKIDLSSEILVLDLKIPVCNGCGKPAKLFAELPGKTECCGVTWSFKNYIGESTAREIAYALAEQKRVRYLSQES